MSALERIFDEFYNRMLAEIERAAGAVCDDAKNLPPGTTRVVEKTVTRENGIVIRVTNTTITTTVVKGNP